MSRASLTVSMGIENPVHLLFIAVVALVVLGPKRLPELARALGKGMREFRAAMSGEGETAGGEQDLGAGRVSEGREDRVDRS
ncbi:MAG TPA: twin-arginine translocase TatA/TatE family subunit [Solirubrobacteraceae bacterium]